MHFVTSSERETETAKIIVVEKQQLTIDITL